MFKSVLNLLRVCMTLMLFFWALTLSANDTDSIPASKGSWGKQILDYFAKSNKPDPNKKIDFGFIAGPHFSSDTGVGLGMLASGMYSMNRADSTLQQSNVSIFSDMTSKGFLLIGLRGYNFFPNKKYKLDYRLWIYTFPGDFWGIGYDNGDNDDNLTEYRRVKLNFETKFHFHLNQYSMLGPVFNYSYVRASHLDELGQLLLKDCPTTIHTVGVGASYLYDSRDFILNAQKGWLVQLDGMVYPKQFGNPGTFARVDFTLATYKKVWKGGVMAGELHAQQNYGDVPWTMMAEVGSSNRMRGYYEGRYRDKNILEAQLELRQHIWKRNGMTFWVGAANVYPQFDEMRLKKTLLNAGIGYRWEFKKGVNVRLDYGFTRNGGGFIFNINEAF